MIARVQPRFETMPRAKKLFGDKGYDADWFRKTLAERSITACIPSKSKTPIGPAQSIAGFMSRIRKVGALRACAIGLVNPASHAGRKGRPWELPRHRSPLPTDAGLAEWRLRASGGRAP